MATDTSHRSGWPPGTGIDRLGSTRRLVKSEEDAIQGLDGRMTRMSDLRDSELV
jgi:hypothetical protein